MQAFEDLLVEIGTEELPPKALLSLSRSFCGGLAQGLNEQDLPFKNIEEFATPRRLACLVRGLARHQPDQTIVRRGPTLAAAFDGDGQPTNAGLGFARACGIALQDMQREETDRGMCLIARWTRPGMATSDLLPDLINRALASLPIPKRMRWSDFEHEFVRPVHWACLIFGTQAIPMQVLGVTAGKQTLGHRFHHPQPIEIGHAGDYAELLRRDGFVEPDFARRRALIAAQVNKLSETVDARPAETPALFEEVTALCEWPQAILCQFDSHYLRIPHEVLIETMQENQRYFPLYDAHEALLPHFIAVANIESRQPERIRAGNERVIRPRFADAAFFFDHDRKEPLENLFPGLEKLVFQERLGSIADKSRRVARIAEHIAQRLEFKQEPVVRAARLAKCDLLTRMIFEFPSLQGIMGSYYASHSGEDPEVATAIAEQYLPRHAGDALPKTPSGQVLALADRLDTLVAIFSIGQRPSGVKDPYALRRSAIAVARLLIEPPLELDLQELLNVAASALPEPLATSDAPRDVFDYILDRLYGYYQEEGLQHDCVDAVLHLRPTSLADADQRIHAVRRFKQRPEAAIVTALYKRVQNLLRKGKAVDAQPVNPALFQDPSETALHQHLQRVRDELGALDQSRDYDRCLVTLARLAEPIDDYFNAVMVMTEDREVQANRLQQLSEIRSQFLHIADLSRLQTT